MERYETHGTCSKEIMFEVKDHKIVSVKFIRGCTGNTQGVAKLAVGRDIDDVIKLLGGIECRNGTSCPDQLARALTEYKNTHPDA